MTRLRWLLVAFWVFVGVMLVWQFSSYNSSVDRELKEHPKQEHFFYGGAADQYTKPAAPEVNPNADVREVDYQVKAHTPSAGSAVATIFLKNVGSKKAIDVQVFVRPYRGSIPADAEQGGNSQPLTDDNYVSQLGQWVTFPDIPPGQIVSQTYTFTEQSDYRPGNNPDPKIVFQTEKDKP